MERFHAKNSDDYFPKASLPFGKIIILFFIVFCGSITSCNKIFAQSLPPSIQLIDSSVDARSIRVGTNKIGNVFTFSGDIDAAYIFNSQQVSLQQKYRGVGVRSQGVSFRDDEQCSLQYGYTFSPAVSLISNSFFMLSNDSRNIGLANLQRLNSLLGVRTRIADILTIDVAGGIEQYRQLGVTETAPAFASIGKLSPTIIDDYSLAAGFNGNYTRFNTDRTNADLSAQAIFFRVVDDGNNLQSSVSYRLLNRDFISPVGSSALLATESRLEERLNINGGLVYVLADKLQTEVQWTIDNGTVNRQYREPIVDVSTTSIIRKLHEFQIAFNVAANYRLPTFFQKVGIEYTSRLEENQIASHFTIDPVEENVLRQSENQRDNSAARTRLFGQSEWLASRKDTIRLNSSFGLLRYDTPATQNYDDRDEFSFLTEATYSRRVSSILSATITAEAQLLHLVYIKSQRSALNNWNRIIRLTPGVNIVTKGLSMQPRFEVLANYTTYDFEQLSGSIQSFSFRQVSVRDSIWIELGRNYRLHTSLFTRYFERGQLSWSTFSETPVSKNFEQFVKLLIFTPVENGLYIGCGGRYYSLRQTTLNQPQISGSTADGIQQFFGPEIALSLQFLSGSKISLNGWYDFQFSNKKLFRTTPTMFLLATYAL
ncbi:MAG: hypothetical protein HYZ54_00770 [Ignavibacteriae bacterium]|nr:hypothetical protein [Ignavibacteriota bacterium]